VAEIKNSAGLAMGVPSVIADASVLLMVMFCGSDWVPWEVDAKLSEAGAAATSGATPMPDTMMVFGELAALEVIVMLPLSAAAAFGAKIRFNTQALPGAILIGAAVSGAPPAIEPKPHQCAGFGAGPLVVSGKRLALLWVMLVRVSVALPLLVMATGCTLLPAPTVVFGKEVVPLTAIAGAEPVPASMIVCGEPGASVVMVRLPLAAPEATGENVNEMVQLPAGATTVQVLPEIANGPLIVVLATVIEEVPLLVTVSACGALVVVTG